jgi:hypothetical protein
MLVLSQIKKKTLPGHAHVNEVSKKKKKKENYCHTTS